MERLIPIINKLQDVFNTVGSDIIDLPQICVVGCQSSGKSSVLESIVGRDFLPRGSGIVTRRPLILQLVHLDQAPAKGEPEEYGEFGHLLGQKFTDFNQINEEIVNETERVTGSGKNVSSEPIRLTLWSPHVLNLTLVDLPGLTKVAVADQPASIVQEIHDMVKSFAVRPNCLILAITPANTDLANSDSLKLAREVDPAGDRTIGVLTKVDLMDTGTNAREILENKVYPLKLGYIGVVNRSQADINTGKAIEQARKDEREFFENHRDYSDLSDRCGTGYLSVVLNRLLMEHIRTCMPSLRHTVQTMLEQKETELAGYGSDPTQSAGTVNAFVLDVITKYLDIFGNLLKGVKEEEDDDYTSRGGAKVSRIFLDQYEKEIDALPGVAKYTEKEVFMMMKNHAGLSVPLFTPHKAFDMILFRAIEQLREPSLKLIDKIVSVLFEIHGEVDFMELTRFNILGDSIRAVVDECIRACIAPTYDFVSALIDNERSFINTARPDFRGEHAIYAGKAKDPRTRPLPEKPAVPDPVGVCSIYGASKELTNHQNAELKDLIQIGSRYFDIIRRQIKDLVPKAIVKFLVNGSTQMLRPKMIEEIFNSNQMVNLLQEDPSITRKRIACQQIVKALRKAQDILLEVRTLKI
jgi:dynamin 1-like protein